ncbi:hypothetical protein ACLB2K_005545 [Fragaria x ananassa]
MEREPHQGEEEDSDSEEAVVDWSDGLCLYGGRDSRTGGVWNPGGLCSRGRGRGVFERKREREREEGDREQGAGKEGEIQREQGRRAKYRRRAKHRGRNTLMQNTYPEVKTTPFQFLQLGARLLRLRVRFLRLMRLGGSCRAELEKAALVGSRLGNVWIGVTGCRAAGEVVEAARASSGHAQAAAWLNGLVSSGLAGGARLKGGVELAGGVRMRQSSLTTVQNELGFCCCCCCC